MARILALIWVTLLATAFVADAATTKKLNWRTNTLMEMNVALRDRIIFYWAQGPTKTGLCQMPYPGICTNGSPAQTLDWKGVTIKGTRRPTNRGALNVTFNAAGGFYFTSPVKGECDKKWFRVNVV